MRWCVNDLDNIFALLSLLWMFLVVVVVQLPLLSVAHSGLFHTITTNCHSYSRFQRRKHANKTKTDEWNITSGQGKATSNEKKYTRIFRREIHPTHIYYNIIVFTLIFLCCALHIQFARSFLLLAFCSRHWIRGRCCCKLFSVISLFHFHSSCARRENPLKLQINNFHRIHFYRPSVVVALYGYAFEIKHVRSYHSNWSNYARAHSWLKLLSSV